MKIATIIPGLPEPADRGTYKRYRALINMLSNIGTVDCCTLMDRDIDPDARERFAGRVHRLCTPRIQFQAWKPWYQQMVDKWAPNVRHWLDPQALTTVQRFFAEHEYDLVVIGDLVSIPYAQAAKLDRFPLWIDRARVDYAYQCQKDATQGATSWRNYLRRKLTLRDERHAAAWCDGQIVCGSSDAEALSTQIGMTKPIEVVPNGIDRSEFPDQGPLTAQPIVMFSGAMDYLPNTDGCLWYLNEVWPQVRSRLPLAEFHIVGRDPIPEIQSWHGRDGVTVTGSVDSMLPWYQQARCVVAPIRIGGGSRLKVAECWAVGRPLVATRIAVDGQNAVNRRNYLEANDSQMMAQATLSVLGNAASDLRSGSQATAPTTCWTTRFATLAKVLNQQGDHYGQHQHLPENRPAVL